MYVDVCCWLKMDTCELESLDVVYLEWCDRLFTWCKSANLAVHNEGESR